jgi:hypothetical protein
MFKENRAGKSTFLTISRHTILHGSTDTLAQGRTSLKRRILAVLIGLFIAVGVCEGIARWFLPPPDINSYYVYDARVGHRMRPNLRSRGGAEGRSFSIEANAAGFRDGPHQLQKPSDTVRIAILGDSFSEGFSVPLEETFFRHLARRLSARLGRDVEILNFAIGDTGQAEQFLLLKDPVLGYKPDAIVLTVFPLNDVVNNALGFAERNASPTDDYRPYYVQTARGLEPHPQRRWGQLRNASALVAHGEFAWLRARHILARLKIWPDYYPTRRQIPNLEAGVVVDGPDEGPWVEGWAVTEALLAEINRTAESHQVPVLFVTIPFKEQVYGAMRETWVRRVPPPPGRSYDFDRPETRFAEIAGRQRLRFVHLLEPLRAASAEPGSLYLDPDGHWTARGHAVVAQILEEPVAALLRR